MNTMTDRISWDEYFYGIAQLIKERSVCLRRKVGALIVRNNQILCTGYNGPPAGHPHPEELGGCERDKLGIPPGQRLELCYCLHAEQNALLQAARHGTSVECHRLSLPHLRPHDCKFGDSKCQGFWQLPRG
jgi:dCMP deaminase